MHRPEAAPPSWRGGPQTYFPNVVLGASQSDTPGSGTRALSRALVVPALPDGSGGSPADATASAPPLDPGTKPPSTPTHVRSTHENDLLVDAGFHRLRLSFLRSLQRPWEKGILDSSNITFTYGLWVYFLSYLSMKVFRAIDQFLLQTCLCLMIGRF